MAGDLTHYIDIIQQGNDILSADAAEFLEAIRGSRDDVTLLGLLQAWENKGWTADELHALADVMRSRMKRVSSNGYVTTDIVGTGGSRNKTFNVSTAAAFVAAAAGVPMAKHGNRAASSNSGSADVLMELGVKVDVDAEIAEKCLAKTGICFMFAPMFHSLSPTLAKARKAFGKPTIFNNLGPLCNPSGAGHQLIGVWSEEWLPRTADVLARLGTTRSWVVNGQNALDEISWSGKTDVAEVTPAGVRHFEISPADFGLQRAVATPPRAQNASESAEVIRRVLAGEDAGAPAEIVVLMNAAAAIHIAGEADDLRTGFEIAEEMIRTGAAKTTLHQLVEATHR